MRTLVVFRTRAKNSEEAFKKVLDDIANENENKSNNAKNQILEGIRIAVNHEQPNLEIYKALKNTPFKGKTIEDFCGYLMDYFISEDYDFSEIYLLADELRENNFEKEASKIDDVNYSVENYIMDHHGFYDYRVFGCIDENDIIYDYTLTPEEQAIFGQSKWSLKPEEWSLDVLKKHFKEEANGIIDDFDIFKNEWWEETWLINIEDPQNDNGKIFFVITYAAAD